MYKYIKDKILPYPKADKQKGSSELEIVEEFCGDISKREKQFTLFDLQ